MPLSRLLISRPNHIYLATYNPDSSSSSSSSSSISIDLNLPFPGNPSWLSPSPSDPSLLYTFDEDANTTHLLKLDLPANSITSLTHQQASHGVCHLELNAQSTRMLGSAYGNGTIDIWDTANGSLQLIKTVQSKHPDFDAANTISHPHQAVLDPTGRFFTVNDLGTDTILLFDSHAVNEPFPIVNRIPVPTGSGPRHAVFYPSGTGNTTTPPAATHYILLCEKSNRLIVFSLSYTSSSIEFTQKASYSTFVATNSSAGRISSCAAGQVVLSPDNKHIYTSNRLTADTTDTVAHFRVLPPGSGADGDLGLELVGETSTGGRLPRMFSLSRSGKELFVGNELGEWAVVVLRIKEDGTLEEKPSAGIKMLELLDEGEEGQRGPKFVLQIA